MSTPETELGWMVQGFGYFTDHLDALDDAALEKPSALPGWTRKHLLSHLGFNARAVGRLVHWAGTGQVTPMYPNTSARAEEIAEGAQWSASQLREFVRTEQAALDAAMRELDEAAWGAPVITGRGRTVPGAELPWMRTREVWIHAVDLDNGGDFTDFPAALIDRLVSEVVLKRRGGDAPNLTVRRTDRDPALVGGGPLEVSPGRVEGTAADLARWLTRRETRGVRTADGSPLPALGPWL